MDEFIINITGTINIIELMESATITVDINRKYLGAFYTDNTMGDGKEYGFHAGPIQLSDGDSGGKATFKIKDGNTSFLGIGGLDWIGASYNVEYISESKRPNYSVRGRVRKRDLERTKKFKASNKGVPWGKRQ